MGFSLRLGCWSPLSGYLAFYMSLFSVAARLPYLNRSAGKIGVNRIQTLAVTRSLSKTAGLLQSLMTHAMTAVSLIYLFFLSHIRFPENDFRKKQKAHCPDKLKRLYQLFSLNFASIKSCEKS